MLGEKPSNLGGNVTRSVRGARALRKGSHLPLGTVNSSLSFRKRSIWGLGRESELVKGALVRVTGPWPESVIIEVGQTGN